MALLYQGQAQTPTKNESQYSMYVSTIEVSIGINFLSGWGLLKSLMSMCIKFNHHDDHGSRTRTGRLVTSRRMEGMRTFILFIDTSLEGTVTGLSDGFGVSNYRRSGAAVQNFGDLLGAVSSEFQRGR